MDDSRTFHVAAGTGAGTALALACALIASQASALPAQPLTGAAADPEAQQQDAGARLAAATLSPEDRSFIEKAAKGGVAEVQEAKLAQDRASRSEIKQGAAELEADHTAAYARLKEIAAAHGVPVPAEPGEERKALLSRLKELQGAQFDDEYLRAGVVAHEKTIALFEKAQKQSQNPAITRFAGETLPTLNKHLHMMRSLQGKAGEHQAH